MSPFYQLDDRHHGAKHLKIHVSIKSLLITQDTYSDALLGLPMFNSHMNRNPCKAMNINWKIVVVNSVSLA